MEQPPSPHPLKDDKLSAPQREAVSHGQGPMVVFSGAGSGKTRVIVSRIARLIEHHRVPPRSICALTFTNKAATEMKERALLLSPMAKYSLISTFHSASARWLREFANLIGFNSQFSILTTQESDAILKKLLIKMQHELGDDEDYGGEKLPIAEYRNFIQRLKVQALTPQLPYTRVYCEDHGPVLGYEIYQTYQRTLLQTNSMDFGDLLLHMVTLLKSSPEVKQTLQNRFTYFLVDEYQDVNPTQFELISHLVPEPYNLMVVGDDDQSIYSWRGADPSNILNFTKSYPSAKVIHLEQNYRSTSNIIGAANALIGHNKIRVVKKLWTDHDPGALIKHYCLRDGSSEASKVCEMIHEELDQFPLHKIAVFYRTNAQSREMEDILLSHNIPYKIYGSLRFYDRVEVKDLLAYMRLAVNPKDDSAFLRLIKTPSRGIGQKTLEELATIGAQIQLSLYETLCHINGSPELVDKVSSRLASKAHGVCQGLTQCFEAMISAPLADVVGLILRYVDYQGYLKKAFKDQFDDKMENIRELGAAMAAYGEQNPNHQLVEWVQDISLVGSEQESVSGVSLMTLHSAKGLEFERVYIIGCDEGLLPHANSQKKDKALEEERRLFYVGMTRAMIKLTLFSAKERRTYYDWKIYQPSRFLKELPVDKVESHQTSPYSF